MKRVMKKTIFKHQGMTGKKLAERYDLLCRVSNAKLLEHDNEQSEIEELIRLVRDELPAITRHGIPEKAVDIQSRLLLAVENLRMFCIYPSLRSKRFIAIGGAFSAGKSTLINSLLGKDVLVADIDPTTSVPTNITQGDKDAYFVLNKFWQSTEIKQREFLDLTHEEEMKYGSSITSLLKFSHVTRKTFPWKNFAIIDTPGYSRPDGNNKTDENLARTQLSSADMLIWVISAKSGGITEEDIKFLISLHNEVPCLIVVSRADAVPAEDLRNVVQLIRQTLIKHKISFDDVLPVSSRNKDAFGYEALIQYLEKFDSVYFAPKWVNDFLLPIELELYIRTHQTKLAKQKMLINTISSLADAPEALAAAEAINTAIEQSTLQWKSVSEQLEDWQKRFYKHIENMGFSSIATIVIDRKKDKGPDVNLP